MKQTPHPQVTAVIRLLAEKNIAPMDSMPAPQARREYIQRMPNVQPAAQPVESVQDLHTTGGAFDVPLRIYRPMGYSNADPLPALIWFHGGGWVIGDLDTHDTLCRDLCNASGCAVVSVDYRLGPEHKFPAAVDDAVHSVAWVAAHASELGIDPDRLAVGGDSAGGNLAAVVSIVMRDSGQAGILFQLLVYPVIDLSKNTASHRENGEGYILTASLLDYFYEHYLSSRAEIDDWRASPIRCDDLSGLPPALILTAGFDPLRDEGAAYAAALTDAGNDATYVCFERQVHGFITMGKVFSDAYPAISLCGAELGRRLRTSGSPR